MYPYVKRAIDLCAAALGALLLSPVLAAIAMLTWLAAGSPVLFRQVRPGRGGRPFVLLKFRTMSDRRDAVGTLSPDRDRLTRIGRFLRSASLDELPELVNVLRGDMSLVGPRPLLMAYLDRYTPEQARRHEVRPGMTGWAQVNGRNALTWDAKFALDVWYVDHLGFWLDARILLKTLFLVARREGISAADHATMPEFLGSDSTDRRETGPRE
jgi:sugar transferase EpsL